MYLAFGQCSDRVSSAGRHRIADNEMTPCRLLIVCLALLAGCASVPDCSPGRGFELGRQGQRAHERCDQAGYQSAWQLGQTLGELEREREALQARATTLSASERMRLRVLQRDIPELETLARIEGLMPPAEPGSSDYNGASHKQ